MLVLTFKKQELEFNRHSASFIQIPIGLTISTNRVKRHLGISQSTRQTSYGIVLVIKER